MRWPQRVPSIALSAQDAQEALQQLTAHRCAMRSLDMHGELSAQPLEPSAQGWLPWLIRKGTQRLWVGPWASALALRLLLRTSSVVRERIDPDKDGEVVIGWRHTILPPRSRVGKALVRWQAVNVSHDGRSIANEALLAFAVGVRPSSAFRIDLRFHISRDGELAVGIAVLTELASKFDFVLSEPVPQVFAMVGRAGIVVLVLRFWTSASGYRAAALTMKRLALAALDEAGVVVSRPERCLHTVREDILDVELQALRGG